MIVSGEVSVLVFSVFVSAERLLRQFCLSCSLAVAPVCWTKCIMKALLFISVLLEMNKTHRQLTHPSSMIMIMIPFKVAEIKITFINGEIRERERELGDLFVSWLMFFSLMIRVLFIQLKSYRSIRHRETFWADIIQRVGEDYNEVLFGRGPRSHDHNVCRMYLCLEPNNLANMLLASFQSSSIFYGSERHVGFFISGKWEKSVSASCGVLI